MKFNEYQDESRKTWLLNHNGNIRAVLGLVGEAGEIAEKYKKYLRGDGTMEPQDIAKELGDVLYYIARVADYTGLKLENIANLNIEKLKDRQKRGKLRGNGDNR